MNPFALYPHPDSGTLWVAACAGCGTTTLIVPTWDGIPRCGACARRWFGVRVPTPEARRAVPRGTSSVRATVPIAGADGEYAPRAAPVVHESRPAADDELGSGAYSPAGVRRLAEASGWLTQAVRALAELPGDLGFIVSVSLRCRRGAARAAGIWHDGSWATGLVQLGDGALHKVGAREFRGVLSA